jgi:hypothetical protein
MKILTGIINQQDILQRLTLHPRAYAHKHIVNYKLPQNSEPNEMAFS